MYRVETYKVELLAALIYLAVVSAVDYFSIFIMNAYMGAFALAIPPLVGSYKRFQQRREQKRKIKKLMNKVFKTVKNISDIECNEKSIIKDILNTTMDFVPINIIDWVVHEIQPNDLITADVFYVVMCWKLIENTDLDDDVKKQLREKLDEKISERTDNSSENIDFQTKIKVALYNIESGLAFDKDCDISQLEDSIWNQFLKKYSRLNYIIWGLDLDVKKTSEEYEMLRKFVNQGKVHSTLVAKALGGSDRVKGSIDAFVLYMNKIQNNPKFESTISLIKHIKLPRENTDGIFYSRRLVFLPAAQRTSQDLIDKLIKPCFAEGEVIDGFVAVEKIGENQWVRFPTEIQEGWTENLKNGWKNLNARASNSEITTLNEVNKNEIAIAEILSVLPLNVFIPDAPKNVKEFIVVNYDELKSTHNIKRLEDWASVNEDDLKNTLIELDTKQKEESGKSRIASNENWEKHVGNIVKKVKNINRL